MSFTLDGLAADLSAKLADRLEPYWLAIVGAPGAGKSTLSRALAQRFGQQAAILPMDGYHYYRNELDAMPNSVEAHHRRGAPFTFNAAKFVDDLQQAKTSGQGVFPSFDHNLGDPIEGDIAFDSSRHSLVIVEGNYLLLNEEPWSQMQTLFDESWFLEVPMPTIQERLVQRFLNMGLSAEQAQARVDSNDLPNARRINNECRERASRIILF